MMSDQEKMKSLSRIAMVVPLLVILKPQDLARQSKQHSRNGDCPTVDGKRQSRKEQEKEERRRRDEEKNGTWTGLVRVYMTLFLIAGSVVKKIVTKRMSREASPSS